MTGRVLDGRPIRSRLRLGRGPLGRYNHGTNLLGTPHESRFMFAKLLCLVATVAATGNDNWPEFRRPHGDSHANALGLPVHYGETENLKWKTPIHGKGWSSPVVWDEQIWLTTAPADGKKLYALCIDRRTGKIVRDIEVFAIEKPAYCIPYNSYASSTPAIEAGRVYVHYGSAGTACLNTADGRILWSRQDLPCDHFRAAGSSPILWKDLLFIPFDGVDLQYIVALDKKTGKTVWKHDRDVDFGTTNPDLKKAYGTPTVISVNGTPQLVWPGAAWTLALNPLTGEEIWRLKHGGMNAAARPIHALAKVF